MKLKKAESTADFIDIAIDGYNYAAIESDVAENPLEILKVATEIRKAIALQRIADALTGYHDTQSDIPAISEAIVMLGDAVQHVSDAIEITGGD